MAVIDRDLMAAQERLLKKRAQMNRDQRNGRSPQSIDWKAMSEKYTAMCKDRTGFELVYSAPCKPEEIEKPVYSAPDIPRNYRNFKFSNFIGNEKLVSGLIAMVDSADDICLTGNTGCGKTHLACAFLNEIKTYDPAKFISVPALLVKARSCFNDNSPITEDELIREYSRCSVLCLDDLGAEKTTAYSIQVLYLIIDQRIAEGKRTIITTNLSLPEIEKQIDRRIASRIAGMVNIKINMPDYRKKRG